MSKYWLILVIFGAVISIPSFAQEKDKVGSNQVSTQNAPKEISTTRISTVKNSAKLGDKLKLPTFQAVTCSSDNGAASCNCTKKCVKSLSDCRCDD